MPIRHVPEPDPESELEDEGIPELEDGYPEQQQAEDPQRMAVPGDEPTAVDDYGTTAREVREDEPLESRVRREEPDPALGQQAPAVPPEEAEEPATESAAEAEETEAEAAAEAEQREPEVPPEEQPADSAEDTRPASRILEQDEGARTDTEKDSVAYEAGSDRGGYTAEEQAVRVEDEE